MTNVPEMVTGILGGNRRALARALTHIENESPQALALIDALYPHTGSAILIGMTGAPGTGKSSLVNVLALHIRRQDRTVGIVAVDPSSPFSQGAVLGDRIRMRDLSGDAGVFIRSMATRGSLGGLSRTTSDVVRALDAAGFDVIIIETVGAGQSEVAIANTAHTVIVVDAPGLGDDIQATKAGILEIADILVVNKADLPGAPRAVQSLKAMLDLGHRMQTVAHHGQMLVQHDGQSTPEIDTWQIPVLKTIATSNEGIEEVFAAVLAHQEHLHSTGIGAEREAARLDVELAERMSAALLARWKASTDADLIRVALERIIARELTPAQAVTQFLTHKEKS
jgi:LAO/AO transport system kinase